jgi:hypothetical protein
MKYLKLFEAFESQILGKTMKFLSQNGKQQFLYQLRDIANRIDFPMSQFSDNFFQYLPFKKALELNINYEDEPCQAESFGLFDNGIKGEFCQEGKIKRNWGRGTRMVVCTNCGGTGVQPKSGNQLKWIKFWFDTKGDFITYTGVDGSVRKEQASDNLENYKQVKELSLSKIKHELKTGQKVLIKLEIGARSACIATVYRDGRDVYMIQDKHNGSTPPGSIWKKYGRWSWQIVNSIDFVGTPYLLEPIEKEEGVKEVNPYLWNGVLNHYLQVNIHQDVEPLIRKASFAIVLNYLDLKKSDYKKKSETIKEREVEKEGALALMTDPEIRSKNINRYIEEISKRVQIDPELKNLKAAVLKMCGGQKTLAFAISGKTNDFSTFISYLYSFIEREDNEYAQENLKYYIKNRITDNKNFSLTFDECIDSFKKSVKEKATTNSLPSPNQNNPQPYIEFVDKLKSVFNEAYEIIKKKEVNTFDDTEFLYYKLTSMRLAWNNTQKFYNIRSVVNNLCSYAYRPEYFISSMMNEDLEKMNKDLEMFRNFVIRYIS